MDATCRRIARDLDPAGVGRRACALHADLAVEEAVAGLVPACTAALGRPVCVVNNASAFEEDTALWVKLSQGKVKHIHFLSAFPEQAQGITDALRQWRFKPYLRDGRPVEVETGIMFGRTPKPSSPPATAAAIGR